MRLFLSLSEKDTKKIGFDMAEELVKKALLKRRKAEVILLKGDLGSGKTAFTKGFASFFGMKKISSPTFNIFRAFRLKNNAGGFTKLIHADLYRIKDPSELENIGFFKEMSDKNNIIVIEWPELGGKKITGTKVNFEYGKKENERLIKISS
jgi:tRNA threonylcarbamoyladenosine biosynthesis protein TsaE